MGCRIGSILGFQDLLEHEVQITSEGLWSTREDKDVPSALLPRICGRSVNQECDLLLLAHPITSGQAVNGELNIVNYVKYLLTLEDKECPEKMQ